MTSDSRSDLMKAIQAAGGAGKANLKSVVERKRKTKQDIKVSLQFIFIEKCSGIFVGCFFLA